MKIFQLCLLTLSGMLTGCSTLDVHSDHDPSADFSKYRTYSWAPTPAGQEPSDSSGVPSGLVEKRIRGAADSLLPAKGLTPAAAGQEGDVVLHDRITQKEKVQSSNVGVGVGLGFGYGPWSGFGAGYPGGSTYQYTQGTVVLDFVEAKSKTLVWRGSATDAASSPEDSPGKIREAVTKILEKYPPSLSRK
ncbi:MAG: DUF4136 domain-containing protein [Methylotenera sp.]|nr:DUF4136 domain-containing protein [Oligoflexia bacterium]